ncbi:MULTISPECIES: CHASE4 domain-containing protein [unclassified Methanoregula]|uniref:CHASE4 domain-containing protein n=1 Tax=unclassified Methanoregula TaxID=2649730 RepID=UPI0009C64E8D|nr:MULTISPECIES: CHASE4 domain-containing protein [unclassified Methanoregula]OPX64052.1 MAG: sensory histidine kinase AtoS [Methanoregula sp. PtaB.Bin085]OPY33750.1 MAG: sensory histidine kinase AtoS [Methanoregula sp. PtaU1.Bin006]
MNLRNRSLLILGLTFFVFFIIIAVVSLSVTLSGLDRIEEQDMGDSMNQSRSALAQESGALLSTAQDWAWWDDMYRFAADRNPEFIESNTQPDALATIHLNLFMILDEKGIPIYGQVLSQGYRANGSVPADLENLVTGNTRLSRPPEDSPGIAGLLLTPDGPMMVASVPILHSDRTGPVHGTLVMGRYLEYDSLRRINELTGFRMVLYPPTPGRTETSLPSGLDRLPGKEEFIIVPDNESWITGFGTIRDLAGRDIVISVTKERQLYRTGYANIVTYLALLALWAILTGLIVVIVMDRTVLQRMGRLTDHVRSLGQGPAAVLEPVLSGNDELAELEKTIITSRRDLLMREEQLRVFVNAMPGPAALFSRTGTILLVNPAFAGFFGKTVGEMTGADYPSLISGEDIDTYNRFVQEAIRTKETIHFESEKGGRTYLVSYYPVLGDDGEVAQLGLLAFDISERKRLENALQRLTKKIALLNTVIFSDIQNKVFVQTGYLELLKGRLADPQLKSFLEKEEAVVREIQQSLHFARQYNEMGMSPPRWQNVMEVMLFAISHLDLGSLKRDFRLEGLTVYADSLLERVFITLIENAIVHAKGATVVRAGFSVTGDEAVIFIEDDGPGIADDRKETIFEKGIGSGASGSLFLSREILSVTGMTIAETGVPGKGARFEIRVPKGSYRFAGK